MPSSEKVLGLDITVPAPDAERASDPTTSGCGEGSRVDHFVIQRKIGAGGMGTVYLARDTSLDRVVAIKVLPEALATNPEAQDRFIREAQAQASLSSPNVVQIYFIGRLRDPGAPDGTGRLYFAMELVVGESLDALLARGERLDSEVARRQMIDAARGLRDAQRVGIVHRDIKPGNLLVDGHGIVKIADFGLAKPRDPKLGLTRQGAVMGTPLYMAPEQGSGQELDFRADMYALGCTYFHLLAGTPPFIGPNAVVVIAKHLHHVPPALRARAPGVSAPLAAVIERLMAKAPNDRFASYDDLLAALDAAAPEHTEYAGFWTRGAASAADTLLSSALVALVDWPGAFLHIAYLTILHATTGQTLAKYVLRIRVQRLDGTRLGFSRALVRTVAGLWLPIFVGLLILYTQGFGALKESLANLSEVEGVRTLVVPIIVGNALLTLVFGAGFGVAAVHPAKRAVHDLLVGSQVVYVLGARGARKRKVKPVAADTPVGDGAAQSPLAPSR